MRDARPHVCVRIAGVVAVESVRPRLQRIRQALEDQLSSIRGASERLEQAHGSIALTGESASRIDIAMRDLRSLGARKFRI
jgi:hypothetical protein